MRFPLAVLAALALAVPLGVATIDYRPPMRKIEITAENSVITILFADAAPAIRIRAVYAGVTYAVPERAAQVLAGREFLSAELRILPYEAGSDGRKVENLSIVLTTLVGYVKRQDIYFSFRAGAVFESASVFDVDASGTRPAKDETPKKALP